MWTTRAAQFRPDCKAEREIFNHLAHNPWLFNQNTWGGNLQSLFSTEKSGSLEMNTFNY